MSGIKQDRQGLHSTLLTLSRGRLRNFNLPSNLRHLWAPGDELDVRYETLYKEANARRIKLLFFLFCAVVCTSELIRITAKYFSNPATTEYHANIPKYAEFPVVLFTFERSPYYDYEDELVFQEIVDAIYEAGNPLARPSWFEVFDEAFETKNVTRALSIVDFVERKLMVDLLPREKSYWLSGMFWIALLDYEGKLTCDTHRGATCSTFETAYNIFSKSRKHRATILEDPDQPGFAIYRTEGKVCEQFTAHSRFSFQS